VVQIIFGGYIRYKYFAYISLNLLFTAIASYLFRSYNKRSEDRQNPSVNFWLFVYIYACYGAAGAASKFLPGAEAVKKIM
jgi:hypothetical protein